jgi:hypothetical protein
MGAVSERQTLQKLEEWKQKLWILCHFVEKGEGCRPGFYNFSKGVKKAHAEIPKFSTLLGGRK